MDYYRRKNQEPVKDTAPQLYMKYIELLEKYMMQERDRNVLEKSEDERRESVNKLQDISQHYFLLFDDKPIQVEVQIPEQEDYRDEQLRRRIEQYNKVMKPIREKQKREKRGRRTENGKGAGHKRKVRTTITPAKLEEMNKIFSQFLQTRQKNKPENNEEVDYLKVQELKRIQHNSLKSIGQKLGLGYSTILHKFRQFRATKKVKGGALIAAMHQKRKYRKSKQIEELISQSLKSHKFYTAVELSTYIAQKHNITLSRSIISRHLGQMGFSYKNVKTKQPNKNTSTLKDCRKKFAMSINYIRDRKNGEIYYLDEYCIKANEIMKEETLREQHREQQFFLLSLANKNGVLKYLLKSQPISEQDLQLFFQEARYTLREKSHPQIIVLDLDEKIHHCPRISQLREELRRNNICLYYLPPHSHQINILEWLHPKVKAELLNYQYEQIEDLSDRIRDVLQGLFSSAENEAIRSSAKESEQYIVRACELEDF